MPALILLSLGMSLLASLLHSSVATSEIATSRAERFETRRATGSVNRMTAQAIWSMYEATLADGVSVTTGGMRAYLDSQGLVDQSDQTPTPIPVDGWLGLGHNQHGELVLGDSIVDWVRVHREDSGNQTLLYVTSLTHNDVGHHAHTECQTDVFALEPPAWAGLEFALLANNIDCIMCHTRVDDVFRIHEGSGVAAPGSYQRARVGSIESFTFFHEPESEIAGTLYMGGPALDADGDVITDWSALSLLGADLTASGQIELDVLGDPIFNALSPVDPSAPTPFGSLYTDYLDYPDQVDGMMPDTFPLPFPDDGGVDPATGALTNAGEGNRIVDDEEFHAKTSGFNGSITGGAIGVSALGAKITDPADAETLAAGNATSLATGTAANVILTGTDLDPIRIDGDVAIDGDLVISGPLIGTGTLWVRGNIYVRGDLEYQDMVSGTDRQYGVAADGTENLLAMAAGGNIVVGDPYRPAWGDAGTVTGDDDGEWNFVVEELVQFNRREYVKTLPRVEGDSTWTENRTGTPTPSTPELLVEQGSPVYEWQPTGNTIQREIVNWVDNGSYKPKKIAVPKDNGLPPPYRKTWNQWIDDPGGATVWKSKWESVGTGTYEDVPETAKVQVGYKEKLTPVYDNPAYMGADYVPRYYAYGEDSEIPIQTKGLVFDPDTQRVRSEDGHIEKWNDWRLEKVGQNDSSSSIMNPTDVQPPVVSYLEPTSDWLSPEALEGLITSSLAARDATESLKIDSTLYSANSVFGVVPNDASDGTNGSIRVQGQLLGADVGLLGPTGMDLFYDRRGADVLDLRDDSKLGLTFVGTLPSPIQ